MAVTSTPHISKLANQIISSFAGYKFIAGTTFAWKPEKKIIHYQPLLDLNDVYNLLHEISHAELGHTGYTSDVSLLRLEASAWQHAQGLAKPFSLLIDPDLIEDSLQTYRLWIHRRSLCPECQSNGLQKTKNTYQCLNCRCSWRTNEARTCSLRRIKQLGLAENA